MTPANDNAAPVARDLNLPRIGLLPLPVAGGAGVDLVAGGFDHASTVTFFGAASSSGKCAAVTGQGAAGNVRAPDPAQIAALETMLAAFNRSIAAQPVGRIS